MDISLFQLKEIISEMTEVGYMRAVRQYEPHMDEVSRREVLGWFKNLRIGTLFFGKDGKRRVGKRKAKRSREKLPSLLFEGKSKRGIGLIEDKHHSIKQITMRAITTGIIFTVSLIAMCATADGMTKGNTICTIICIASLVVFALNGAYMSKHEKRLLHEIDEMFPDA